MNVVWTGILLMSFLSCKQVGNNAKMESTMMKQSEGIWQQAREVKVDTDPEQHLSNTYTFKYENGHVTMALLTISKFKGVSDDGFYLLDSRWEGNKLSIRFPNGSWDELAIFSKDHFEMYGDGFRREYERVTPEQVVDFSRGILKEDRKLFDYSLQDK